MGVDYYNTLKISRDASEEDVKRSYKRLAMKWHPDKNAVNKEEAEAKFKQISEAYDVLGDPRKRRIYDLHGEEGVKAGLFSRERDAAAGLRGFGFGFAPRTAEEVFEEFFGGFDFVKERRNGGDAGLKKAAPMESQLPCSLEELYKGSKRKMKISRIVLDESGKPGTVEEVLSIHIKPGWKKGTKITFPEKGNHEPDAAPGDLIFVIDEKPHPVFKRDGNDLIVYQKISLLDALTGKILNIATLDGRDIPLTLSDIVKPGQEVVIENEGMPISKEPGKNGNLRIKFDVKFPSRLSAEQKLELRRVLGRSAE
ncbi:potyviral capsid protein interacting protein 1 [Striga asiatica]|uniref:Potyviral capsid protein interacting protein 1 n=1 Tax=Striga asiatica TaxID=4170 RepID=A0A5A7PI54_STRAF|nr:potyviral capsid protein interacting protein 1 [Striga asiatica]